MLIYNKTKVSIASFISSIWAISAVLGLFYKDTELYRGGLYPITFTPFLYMFICFLISLLPIIVKSNQITSIKLKDYQWIKPISYIISILSIVPAIELTSQFFELIVTGQFLLLGENYEDVANGEEEALINVSSYSRFIIKILISLKVLIPILFYLYLNKAKYNKKVLIGLFFASIIPALNSMAMGGKTELVYFILYFSCLYLIFKKSLKGNTVKSIKKIIRVISISGVILILGLSIGRYGAGSHNTSNSGPFDFLMQYSSETMYNFNQNAYHEKKGLDGYITMLPVLYKLKLTKVKPEDRREYMSERLNCPTHIFYSTFGDLYLDFGFTKTLAILILLSFAILAIIKKENYIEDIALIATYVYILSTSLFYFCFKGNWNPIFINIIIYIVAKIFRYISFKKDYNGRNKNILLMFRDDNK